MSIIRRLGVVLLAIGAMAAAPLASAQPSFSKQFQPDSMGPGSASLLRFQISNNDGVPVTDLAFTDVLPAGVTLATPAHPTTTCTDGLIAAPDGGGTISFSNGRVGGNASCVVDVYVTASTLGTYMNVSGDLTSSAGNSGPATDDLDVVANRPGFTKSFSPSMVQAGERSTLTFTIDNSANAGFASGASFVDVLPPTLEIASPTMASTDCTGATLTAEPGGSSVSILNGLLPANTTCTVSVDVVPYGLGQLDNISGELTASPGGPLVSSGVAVATLHADADILHLQKSFLDDPVPPGGTATLRFSIGNFDRNEPATGISFTDDLDATLSGLVAVGLPLNDVCGAGSTISGTSLLTLSNGSLPGGETCEFEVTVQVPAGATAGEYPNTTSTVSADQFGAAQVYSPASDSLFVSEAPSLTKTFLANPVGGGETVTLEFTVQNSSSTSAATDIAFVDFIDDFLNGVVVASLPASGFCGAGSILFVNPVAAGRQLTVSGGNLAAGGSCTFSVNLLIPPGTAPGAYLNRTSAITATVDGSTQTGNLAEDTLTVVSAPDLRKEFIDDPVLPGDTVTLRFTIDNSTESALAASNISFADDLNATMPGLVAIGLPLNDVCGVGSQINGPSSLGFIGGTLATGASCSFDVTLQVPAAGLPGNYINTTSALTANASGVATTGTAASDTLIVSGLSLNKAFTDDPVLPGDTVTLEFTIDNTQSSVAATGISFTDNLNSMLSGTTAVAPLPTEPCGAGSSISGTTTLVFTAGSLTAGSSCTFSVTVQVPGGAASGDYGNTTSSMSATIGGSAAILPAAQDVLSVNDNLLFLQKQFTDDPVMPGDTVTLEFTLTNQDAANAITGIAFTDDLDASLSGLAAVGLPVAGCGGTAAANPDAGTIDFTGGSLAAGASCSFSVTLQVPGGAASGDYVNTTSSVSGIAGALGVSGDPAADTLRLRVVDFGKAFDGPTAATQTAVLSFTISNLDATNPANGLAFTDDLDAVLAGLVATGLPLNDVCGTGSQISGSSVLTFSGGSLAPGSSCSFDVTVQVPATAVAGSYPNSTSDLTASGLGIASPATADLVIEPPPTFAKAFVPATVGVGQVSTLTFSIDNTASAVAANALAFTDNLPAGLSVAATPNVSTTCVGGTVTAAAGAAVVSYSGGAVGAGSNCTLSVDVVSLATAGALLNTSGDLSSSNGNSGTASDTLTVIPQPGFAKVFTPDAIAANATSTLTFTIDNSASAVVLTGLAFSDNLPAGMTVATPASASTTCTGGTVTATAGSSTIQYSGGSVAAGASCTVQADVTAATPGSYANSSGSLMSNIGIAGVANDTLTVVAAPLFSKTFAPNPVAIGQSSTLSFLVDNSASALAATSLDFSDNLPAGLLVATPANASTTCTGGTLTAVSGSGVVSYSGGSVAAGATCTVSVDTSAAAAGDYANSSGDLTSSSGDSGSASDTLSVVEGPLFGKAFAPATVEIGGISTLTFSIDNAASPLAATALDFSDNLPAGMVVANPANASTTCTGGTITAAAGSAVISYSGGSVAAGASCTVSVNVQAQATGTLTNTSGVMTSSGGNSGTASADLIVTAGSIAISKAFQGDPVLRGGQVVLRYTIDNPSVSADVDNVAFSDDLGAVIPGWAAVGLPLADVCGVGSSVSGTTVLGLSAGTIPAGGSCTFDVTLQLPASAPLGIVSSTSGAVSAESFGSPVTGNAASDTLQVVWFDFGKSFAYSGDPQPDTDIGLSFSISNPDGGNTATGISFSDDLEAAVPGMVAVGLPMTDVCGPGSVISGSSVVTLSNATLPPGEVCNFQITVHLPADIVQGTYTNVTSPISADAGGGASTGDAGSEATASIDLPFGSSVPSAIQAPELIPTLDPRWLLAMMAIFLMVVAVRLRPNG